MPLVRFDKLKQNTKSEQYPHMLVTFFLIFTHNAENIVNEVIGIKLRRKAN